MAPPPVTRRLSILALVLFAVFHSRRLVGIVFDWNEPHGPSPWAVLSLLAFVVIHGRARLGGRALAVFAGITIFVTLFMEDISIRTGLAGEYYYTEKLGPKLDVVPVLIPIAWLMMMYPTMRMVEVIGGNVAVRSVRDARGLPSALAWAAWLSLQSAFAMAAWDLGCEPIIVQTGEYVWKDGGPYFGVPIANFVSWVVISFTVCFSYYLYEVSRPVRPDTSHEAPDWLPVAAYAATTVITFAANLVLGLSAPAMIALFVMAPYAMAAATRLGQPGGAAR